MTSIFDDDRSRLVAKKIDVATEAALSMSPDDIESMFSALEDELLGICENDYERIETRRRLAEGRLRIHLYSKVDQKYFDDAWRDLDALGYSNVERHASTCLQKIMQYRWLGRDVEADQAIVNLGKMIENDMSDDAIMAEYFRDQIIRRSKQGG